MMIERPKSVCRSFFSFFFLSLISNKVKTLINNFFTKQLNLFYIRVWEMGIVISFQNFQKVVKYNKATEVQGVHHNIKVNCPPTPMSVSHLNGLLVLCGSLIFQSYHFLCNCVIRFKKNLNYVNIYSFKKVYILFLN